ncbi:alkaline phosphatase-like protein [Rhizopus microsporus var. microsporus]|uniref:Alkaline phosphatase n=2 Tax=Rhizopus microsporus TaxID=58291 RepID=A0A2G4SS80_RHIZD|nr:alkaline phosphatase-like protein [Rhizopus microsporus ATCC 52813]ORE08006.1 alkaline phosphatase-like protein [Rhizopus microsporus var. microsporus]PHZ11605.1 alkaline phosphatase-like protein [Rhizopus microsporus ATCC 52813]
MEKNKQISEPLLNSTEDIQEDIILDNEWSSKRNPHQPYISKYKLYIIGSCCITILSTLIIALTLSPFKLTLHNYTRSVDDNVKPKNIIMMISDGLGPASVSFARTYYQYTNNKPYDYQMPLDTIHIGQSRTRSSSTLVTDSAAGATAFSCNIKTYNGAVGVDPHKNPCGTILESAKHTQGMLTALVATSRITHATPASFSAHVTDRDNENKIAVQQIGDNPLGRSVDLMFGGGYCYFLPKSSKDSCRSDQRHLLNEAKDRYDWNTVIYNNKTAFDDLPVDPSILPAISLFSFDHMAYEIDRVPSKEPSLSEMSQKALDILFKATENSDKGFFIMIEGSRIDMAAHSNDPATHVHEILEYQRTVELVKKYVDEHPDTIMISTSDHETGGLSLARQVSQAYPEYLWYPDVLAKVKSSTVALADLVSQNRTKEFVVETVLKDRLGIADATDEEIEQLLKSGSNIDYYLAEMVSIRAQLGWATHGHSGVDVNLYAYGNGTEGLAGSHENTEIGQFITSTFGLNLKGITEQLNKNNPSFHLSNMTAEDKLEYNRVLQHYHFVPSHLKHPNL